MLDYLQFNSHDPQQLYFLSSSEDFYVNSVLLNIAYFVSLKVLHLLFFLVRKKHKLLKSIYSIIKIQTKWWTLLVALLEMNMVVLTYNSSLQFLLPSALSFVNKANFIFCICLRLVLILYFCCFY